MHKAIQERLDKINVTVDQINMLNNKLGDLLGMTSEPSPTQEVEQKKEVKVRKGKKVYSKEELIQLFNTKKAGEIAEITGKSISNVYMIKSLFKKKGLLKLTAPVDEKPEKEGEKKTRKYQKKNGRNHIVGDSIMTREEEDEAGDLFNRNKDEDEDDNF